MEYQRKFDCVATGSFNQADQNLFPRTHNTQCVANATCALVVNYVEISFDTSTINDILMKGDELYQRVQAGRDRMKLVHRVFLDPEELVSVTNAVDRQISIRQRNVQIDRVEWVNQKLWPATESAIQIAICSLADILKDEMEKNEGNGFLFTGLSTTVSFWRKGSQFFLFDSHAVNSRRVHDAYPSNNRARLFRCTSLKDLAGLLLNRLAPAAQPGRPYEYCIHRVYLSMGTSQLEVQEQDQQRHILPEEPMQISPLPHVDMAMEVDSFRSSSKKGRPQKKKRGPKPGQKDSSLEKSELIRLDQPSTPKKSIIRPAKLVQIGLPRTPKFDVSDKEVVVYSPRQDPKLQTLAPVVCLSPLDTFAMSMDDLGDTASVSHTSNKGKGGRSKKIKRGRPKTLGTTRKEQLKAARKRYVSLHRDVINETKKRYILNNPEVNRKSSNKYTEKYPDVHRESVKKYNQDHPKVHQTSVHDYSQRNPDVSRESTRRYDQQYPEEHLVRNRRFRVNNPTDGQVRHLPVGLRRAIRENGPMAYWDTSLICTVQAYKLEKINLLEEGVHVCTHCGARLFEEERERKKWCCGQGAYNVLQLAPLEAPFYQNPTFLQRARAFNDMFAFCALTLSGEERHPRNGLAFFKIDGRMYHQVHNLEAPGRNVWTGSRARLVNQSRLYLDDGEERRAIAEERNLDTSVIDDITHFITETSPYISSFRLLGQEPSVHASLRFEITNRSTHGAVLGDRNTGVEVHAVLCTDQAVPSAPRTLTIWKVGEANTQRLSVMSALMEPFQYPLLYPQGTPGWHINRLDNQGRKLSQYCYTRCLLLSELRFSSLGRLSQTWQVEMFARYEEEKFNFIKGAQQNRNSTGVRTGPYDEIVEARNRRILQDIVEDETVQGEGGVQPGRVYLPCKFVGGPRYMKVHYENAMALVARKGPPTFFLTFTYSAQWEEHKTSSRGGYIDPSVACRIFQIKLLELLRDLKSGALFGRLSYLVYVFEVQMRGLPHAHIVFKVEGEGPLQANEIDSVIWAVIPSEEVAGGRLRSLVLQHMIHGPCDEPARKLFLCRDTDKNCCSKFYPKPDVCTTHTDHRGFVQYRRDYNNKGKVNVHRRRVDANPNVDSSAYIEVHDGWVVPYNPTLLLKYEAHINLELASTRRVIKYLFKYLMKGGSLQNMTVTSLNQATDEVEYYVTKRMVGASDACWRLLDFNISESHPTVECLPVHLEGKQTVLFRIGFENEAIEAASSRQILYFQRPTVSLFDDVTYQSFYENYIVDTRSKTNTLATEYAHPDGKHVIRNRQRGEKVCRLFWVSPQRGEQYYLRILLMSIPCRGFQDLLGKGGSDDGNNLCTSFQEVARRLGLVDDEQEYHDALREASVFMVGPRFRSFFVLLVNMGAPAALLWQEFRDLLAEDHLERNPGNPDHAYELALLDIDRSLRRQGSCLTDHGLPFVRDGSRELGRELLAYTEDCETSFVDEWLPRLAPDQRLVFDHIRSLINSSNEDEDISRSSSQSRVLFLDGPGGYGKTQLIRVLLAEVRRRNHVAIAVASSGIAARNMPGGTTAHSMFCLPLDLGDGTGTWGLTNASQRAELIRSAQLIVFDEAPMAHRYIFEMLNNGLQDLMQCDALFGGKVFLCSGDFRQIAPVVPKARSPQDIVCVSLRSSWLWQHIKVFHLTTAQRTSGSTAYSEFLLSIGNGTAQVRQFGEGRELESRVALQGVRYVTSLEELIAQVFPANILRDSDVSARRAILAPLNVNVNEANRVILDSLDSPVHELLSADSVVKEAEDGLNVDIQLLNQATGQGVPNHALRLKIGCVCLIMRNLNIADGLVNGTKVIVTAISPRLITVRMPASAELFGIPRIQFKFPFVEGSPLQINRRQFPLMLAYAMSGHKSQGQTIEYVGLDLRTDCFTHGQLYVMLSRVRTPENILVLIDPEKVFDNVAYVKNIVYEDLLL